MRNILVNVVTIAGADLNYDSQDMVTPVSISTSDLVLVLSEDQPNVTLQKKRQFTFIYANLDHNKSLF